MLNQNDLKQFKETVTEVIDERVNPQFKKIREEFVDVINERVNPQFEKMKEEFGQVIEDNINPQFEEVNKRLDKVEKDTTEIKATMVTKSYLDDKLADLEGGLIVKLRKEDEKLNRLIEIMKGKSLLEENDVKHLNELQVFPRLK